MRHVGPVVKTIGAVARIAFKRKEICRGERYSRRYWEIEEASELTRYRTLLTAKRHIAMESAINELHQFISRRERRGGMLAIIYPIRRSIEQGRFSKGGRIYMSYSLRVNCTRPYARPHRRNDAFYFKRISAVVSPTFMSDCKSHWQRFLPAGRLGESHSRT